MPAAPLARAHTTAEYQLSGSDAPRNMSRKRHNSFIDGVGGGPVAPTGSAVTNATVAGSIIKTRERINVGTPGLRLKSDSSATDDVKAAIRRGDMLFQSTDPRYNLRGPVGSASIMVFATFDGLTAEQALFETRLVGMAEADNIPFNSFENLEGREVAVAMHGTRGTPGSNNVYKHINCGGIVVALPNFDNKCRDPRQKAKAVFWELTPPQLDAFTMPQKEKDTFADINGSWAATPQYLMRHADRAQIICSLAKHTCTNVNVNFARILHYTSGRSPLDPVVAAIVLRSDLADANARAAIFICIQNATIADAAGVAKASPLYAINERIAPILRAQGAAGITPAYAHLLVDTANAMAQAVLSNFVVGRALAHCSTEDNQLQLLVSRSVIF